MSFRRFLFVCIIIVICCFSIGESMIHHAKIISQQEFSEGAKECSDVSPHQPRFFAIGGCSKSTPITMLARTILSEFGINIGRSGNEVFKPSKQKNHHYVEGVTSAVQSTNLLLEEFQQKNQTLLSKIKLTQQFRPWLKSVNARIVVAQRTNFLDHIVCAVRDCFDSNSGYPIDVETGKQSHLCFQRRFSQNQTTKAFLHPQKLVDQVHRKAMDWKQKKYAKEAIRSVGKQVQWHGETMQISTEKLLQYEIVGSGNLETSVLEWEKVLKAWCFPSNRDKIRSILENQTGKKAYASRSDPPPHNETIWNIEEVRTAFEQSIHHKEICPFLRPPC